MLTFEDAAIKTLIEDHQRALNRNPISNGWCCGPIVDNFSGWQGKFFWALGAQNRTPGDYAQDPSDKMGGATNEYFHPIVRNRKNKVPDWNPPSLEGYVFHEPDGNNGWRWTKTGLQAVPEYVIDREKAVSVAYEDGGSVKYRVDQSLSRRLCPPSILSDLDRDNGIAN